MKKIAILIPVFNNIAFTKKCILRLNELISNISFNNCSYHVVVIDDGSSDGTSDWLREAYPHISLLQGDGDLWWSGGINMGANYSISELNADFLLLWNNDIIPSSDYFKQIDSLVSEIDNQTIVGSKIYYYRKDQEDMIWSFGGFFNPRNGNRSMLAYNRLDCEDFSQPIEVDWLPGMGTLVPVEIIRRIGLWDDKVFPQYHGDSDFTFRAKIAGYKIISYPQLRIWNDKTVSGISHGGTIGGFIKTLTDRRSNSNIMDIFRFYKRHSSSIFAYKSIIAFYFIYFGSFCKWKFLSLFGIRKKEKF